MTREFGGARVSAPVPRPGKAAAQDGRRWGAPRRWALPAARAAVSAGLAVDAYVHLNLASTYAEAGGVINEGMLFRAEAVAALLAAAGVAVFRRRAWYLAAFAVAASALATMLVSRYVDLGAIGPFPDLYDPVWYPEKLLAAFAEGTATLAALIAAALYRTPGKAPPPPARHSSSH